jgi:hypothetical protein
MSVGRPITPEMKVGEFLDAFPTLEETLIAIAPEFGKLRNPILRRTVAKVATLEQAARIAGIDVRDLVRRLRVAAGQPVEERGLGAGAWGLGETGNLAAGAPGGDDRPEWLDEARVDPPVDADAILRAGEHPLGAVRQRLRMLEAGRILCIVSSFRPVPLVDALASEGYTCFMAEEAGRVRTYITRLEA